MTMNIPFEKLLEWGYWVLPPNHDHCLGHSGLLVLVGRDGSEQGVFVLQAVQFATEQSYGDVEQVTIEAGYAVGRSYPLVPGRIHLISTRHERTDFFTFGGQLLIESLGGQLLVVVQSPAPIVEMTPDLQSMSNLFVAEAEVYLAMRAAAQLTDDKPGEEPLPDPAALYGRVVAHVHDQLVHLHQLSMPEQALRTALHQEQAWMRENAHQSGDLNMLPSPL